MCKSRNFQGNTRFGLNLFYSTDISFSFVAKWASILGSTYDCKVILLWPLFKRSRDCILLVLFRRHFRFIIHSFLLKLVGQLTAGLSPLLLSHYALYQTAFAALIRCLLLLISMKSCVLLAIRLIPIIHCHSQNHYQFQYGILLANQYPYSLRHQSLRSLGFLNHHQSSAIIHSFKQSHSFSRCLYRFRINEFDLLKY